MQLDERHLWAIEDLEACRSLETVRVRLEEIEVRRHRYSNSITSWTLIKPISLIMTNEGVRARSLLINLLSSVFLIGLG